MEQRLERLEQRLERLEQRLERLEQRFEEKVAEDRRRFDRIDQRFDKVFERFDELSLALGHDFEEFNSHWLETFLVAQGFPKIEVRKRTFFDPEHMVFPDSTDVEVDLFNEDPLVVGEVTAIVRTIDKVTTFLRKVKFIESNMRRKADYKLFITYMIVPEIREEAKRLLEGAGVTVITLRQRHGSYS